MNPDTTTSQVCLLLGSNIAAEQNLPKAIALLQQYVEVAKLSKVWETPAIGSMGPNFLNAAVLIQTDLKSDELKNQVLSAIEADLGRVRTADKYASRPIDIDIIAWECQVTDPDVWHLAHVAVPVAEVLPCDILSDQGESLAQVAARLMHTTSIRLHGTLPSALTD